MLHHDIPENQSIGHTHASICQRFKATALLLLSLPLLSACYLNIHIGDSDDPEPSSPEHKEIWIPEPGLRWHWQLEHTDSLVINQDITVYDVDLFAASEGGNNSLIRRLKRQNKKVICYFSAGTREDWRPDAGQFTADSVIADGQMQDWPNEVWLDISDQTALRQVIQPIMAARLDLAGHAGCDGVEADNVDAYTNTDETRGLISEADQLAYNIWLATAAHERKLSIGLKNDLNQLETLVDYFDFAINEQCFAYNECSVYENTFLTAGKAVFNQEYYTNGSEGEISSYEFRYSACPYFDKTRISGGWKQGYALDGSGVEYCP